MADMELLKVWHKGLQECREKILQKPEANGASFKDTLTFAKAAGKRNDEDMLKKFTLLDAYDDKKRAMFWTDRQLQRREKHRVSEKEADAIETQRIRKIKAENFLRARYGK